MQDRREFVRSCMRYGVLGVMATGGLLLGKRRGVDRSTQRCVSKGVCCGCRMFEACGLPAALSAKQSGACAPSVSKQDKGMPDNTGYGS